jgi:ubiquinone/menaquinone biosynthesis C-methylase UbiE
MQKTKNFYDTKYHFVEDIYVGLDYRRIKNYFKGIKFDRNQKYLDIGCGVGWALKYCKEKGVTPFGIDISKKALKLAKRLSDNELSVVLADGQLLPFDDESFDLVSALGTIEHFDSPSQGLREINRVIKKQGEVIIVVPNSYGVLNKLEIYKGTEQEQEMMVTLAGWVNYIRNHGFAVIKINRDIGPKILKNKSLLGIIKRTFLKTTVFLPMVFAYCFIFLCRRK